MTSFEKLQAAQGQFPHYCKCDFVSWCRSPLRWLGGKFNLSKRIIPLFPEHICYVEPFMGAAHCFFRKTPSPVEVINDINGELVNFFRVLSRFPEYFEKKLEWALYSREEFERLKHLDTGQLSDEERAERFNYLNRLAFGTKEMGASPNEGGMTLRVWNDGYSNHARTFADKAMSEEERAFNLYHFNNMQYGARGLANGVKGDQGFGTGATKSSNRQNTFAAKSMTDEERAFRYLYINRCAFGSKHHQTFDCASNIKNPSGGSLKFISSTFGCGSDNNALQSFFAKMQSPLRRAHNRLKGCIIEHKPYADVFRIYDRPHTFFYVDPPYYGHEKDYGKGLFERSDFEKLADILRNLKGMFLLSINDTPETRDIFSGFKVKDEFMANYSANKERNVKKPELLIANY